MGRVGFTNGIIYTQKQCWLCVAVIHWSIVKLSKSLLCIQTHWWQRIIWVLSLLCVQMQCLPVRLTYYGTLCFVFVDVEWKADEAVGPDGCISQYSVYLWLYSISGTVAVVVTCPLEVVKTRFQSSGFTSLIRTVSHTQRCAYSASAVPGTSCLVYELPGKTAGTLHSFLHKSPTEDFLGFGGSLGK